MPKDVYCEMCDKWFPLTRTAFCPLCGMTLRRSAAGRLVTDPRADAAVDPVVANRAETSTREKVSEGIA